MIVPQSFEDGLLRTDEIEDIAAHVNGLPYTADGSLAVSLEGTVNHVSGGIPFDVNGRVCVGEGDPAWYLRGLAVTSAGRLCVAFSGDAVLHIGGLPATAAGAILANLNAAATFALDFEQDDYFGFSPAFSHTRATASALVQQFDGSFVQMLANEWGREGGRRVENLRNADPAVVVGATQNATVSGNDITLSASGNSFHYLNAGASSAINVPSGATVFYRVTIACAAGTRTIGLRHTGSSISAGAQAVTVGPDPTEFWVAVETTATGTFSFGLENRGFTGGIDPAPGTFTITEPFIQIARPGQTEPDPEYVSRGVLSAPYHGWGVDGVAWFKVDEEGADLTSASSGYPVRAAGIVRRPAVTNLQRHSNALASWATVLNLARVNNSQILLGRAFTLLTANAATTATYVIDQFNSVSGTAYTAQAKVKAGTLGFIQITFTSGSHGGSQYANINLSTGLVTYSEGCTCAVEAMPEGIWLIKYTATATITAASAGLAIVLIQSGSDARAANLTWAGTESVLVADVQIEASAVANAFVPTTTTAVTADADVITLDKDEIGYSAAGGVWVIEHTPAFDSTVNAGAQSLIDLYTSSNERALLYNRSGDLGTYIVDGAAVQWAAADAAAEWTAGQQQRVAWRVALNDGSLVSDGVSRLADASMTVPDVASIILGGSGNGDATKYSGTIERIAYYAEPV